MKLRSRGLGRKELVMDFREYEITRDGDDVVVSGTIHEPVNWDFTIRISGDDIPGMLRLGMHRQTLAMAWRWVIHRRARVEPVVEAQPVRDPRPVAPRAPVPEPAASPRAVAPAKPRAPEPRANGSAKTPDFGMPRRRGATNGEAVEVITQGERP